MANGIKAIYLGTPRSGISMPFARSVLKATLLRLLCSHARFLQEAPWHDAQEMQASSRSAPAFPAPSGRQHEHEDPQELTQELDLAWS